MHPYGTFLSITTPSIFSIYRLFASRSTLCSRFSPYSIRMIYLPGAVCKHSARWLNKSSIILACRFSLSMNPYPIGDDCSRPFIPGAPPHLLHKFYCNDIVPLISDFFSTAPYSSENDYSVDTASFPEVQERSLFPNLTIWQPGRSVHFIAALIHSQNR